MFRADTRLQQLWPRDLPVTSLQHEAPDDRKQVVRGLVVNWP